MLRFVIEWVYLNQLRGFHEKNIGQIHHLCRSSVVRLAFCGGGFWKAWHDWSRLGRHPRPSFRTLMCWPGVIWRWWTRFRWRRFYFTPSARSVMEFNATGSCHSPWCCSQRCRGLFSLVWWSSAMSTARISLGCGSRWRWWNWHSGCPVVRWSPACNCCPFAIWRCHLSFLARWCFVWGRGSPLLNSCNGWIHNIQRFCQIWCLTLLDDLIR